ncbi:hypothetical protein DFQ01_11824 [Paenibacillus cellulosilyticus]|uniref:Uncharacterized protein n=1 Tax=Paenibacillus cellulosilyticus TaxID=375489 RepID=A0A2V2YPG3_9BACL|nr:hypothetical protein [Paenibacillus cellulosilyticus]PWV98390.1 hypothetical protein DFQ01_11824 [Paenibacillus cellulosilyticus]QKS43240.1 hypothetical protein HUB94_01840 [Paenibacillus cellulosilyticus]
MRDDSSEAAEGIAIHASYSHEAGAREAAMKLRLLRAEGITGDGSFLSATVNPDVLDRALYLIRQTGGEPNMADAFS